MNIESATDLRSLQCFDVLADLLHFGRAAGALGIAQPPLSIRIRQLEASLGVRLFERGRGGVRLTAAGRSLKGETAALLARHAAMLERARAAARGEVGALRIGFVTPAEYSFLPDRLREFRGQAPGVRLQLHEMTSDAQAAALLDGTLDAGFVLPPLAVAGLQYRPVFRDSLIVALPSRHRLARTRAPLAVRDVAGEPLVIFPRDKAPGLHDDVISLFAAAGVAPVVGQEAIQMQTIVSLVAAGLGIAIVPASLRNLGRKGVAYRALKGRSPSVEIGIAVRAGDRDPALERFVQFATRAGLPARDPVSE